MKIFSTFLKEHLLGMAIFAVATGVVTSLLWEHILEMFDECENVVAIKELGWSSGHKTKYCIAAGFDGNFNFDEYRAGGYCYKGDYGDCKARIYPNLD